MIEFIKSTALGGAIIGLLFLLVSTPILFYVIPVVCFSFISFGLGAVIREAIRESRAND